METENVTNKNPTKERKIDENNEWCSIQREYYVYIFKSLNNESCKMKYNFRTAYW